MLYVVAWPILAEADDTALRRLRSQYLPGEADLIGPHFTLVFGAQPEREAALRTAVDRAARSVSPFWFVIERMARFDAPPPSRASYLFAEPYDGAVVLMEMHDILNPTPGPETFDPHITVGLFERAAEAEQVARIVERQHLPMHGRVEELALLSRDDHGLTTLASVRLGG